MGLEAQKEFSYLTIADLEDLETAFVDSGVEYDKTRRDRLLFGVNRQYTLKFLPNAGGGIDQLNADLIQMNRTERLSDGTVPLSQWLHNAAYNFRVLPERSTFERILNKVSGSAETAAPPVAVAETPAVDFEEIITDDIDDLQDVSFLATGASRLKSVAKLLVPAFKDGTQVMLENKSGPSIGSGTGWLIASDLMITNYHVVRNRPPNAKAPSDNDLVLQATGIQAQFFFDADGQEGTKIAVGELIVVGKERTEDFALLRLAKAPGVSILPLKADQFVMPKPQQTPAGTAKKVMAVNIIQHPNGGPKRVAIRNNLVYSADYPTLHYFTDTLGGSSGSPVLDDSWRVVGLHRAAVPTRAEFHGKTLGYVNEGVQIHAIMAALTEKAKTDGNIAGALAQIKKEQDAFDDF